MFTVLNQQTSQMERVRYADLLFLVMAPSIFNTGPPILAQVVGPQGEQRMTGVEAFVALLNNREFLTTIFELP